MLQSPFSQLDSTVSLKFVSISVLPTGRIWICLFCIYIPCTINVFCPSISPFFFSLVLYRNSIQFCFPVLIHNRCVCVSVSVSVCVCTFYIYWFTLGLRLSASISWDIFFPFSAFPWKSHYLQQFIFVLSTLVFAFGIYFFFIFPTIDLNCSFVFFIFLNIALKHH